MSDHAPISHSSTNVDVAIVGGGASGTALLYVLARYTNIKKIALIEKYSEIGSVNSSARNNSQTLHVGDIETNYSIDKVRQVHPAAMMVKRYTDSLPKEARAHIIHEVQKMVLAVGPQEVGVLEEKYSKLKEIFPELEKLSGEEIARVEPEVMRGRRHGEVMSALFNPRGYAVDFGALARSFVEQAREVADKRIEIFLGTEVLSVSKKPSGTILRTTKGDINARIVVFDADAYSLGFAKKLGYGKQYSLIPIAGSFFFSRQLLRGKVYRVQDPRMPFAAVHGDPDLTIEGKTRWGPTARFYPALEARKFSTAYSFFAVSGFHRIQTWISFASILLDPVRFWYLLRNLFYDLPVVGRYALLPQLRKIVPTIQAKDLQYAKGYGGMRLQRVDTATRELLLGEGKIIGDNMIFNMTPSPGASVSLYNAMRDADQIQKFAPDYVFDKSLLLQELCPSEKTVVLEDVSLRQSYAS
jgi:L-2-hydroxyglutarate oxidase LhgO